MTSRPGKQATGTRFYFELRREFRGSSECEGQREFWPSPKTVFSIESSQTLRRTLILPGSILAIERREIMRPNQRITSAAAVLVLLVILAAGLLACNSSSNSGTSNPGTTPGAYTVTVTGTSGSTTATGTFTLTVQ